MPEATTILCPYCEQEHPMTPEEGQQRAGDLIQCSKCQRMFRIGPLDAMAPPADGTCGVLSYGLADSAYFPQQSNGMAVASLVLGLILCFPPCSLLAIIFGGVGIARANQPYVGGRGKGLAVAGLVLGIVGILGWVLFVITLPTIQSSSYTVSPRTASGNNLRQIGLAMQAYANELGGKYPPDLGTLATREQLIAQLFISPFSSTTVPRKLQTSQEAAWINANSDYVYLGAGKDSSESSTPANSVLAYEKLGINKGAGTNVLFGDNHVAWMTLPEIKKILAQQGVTPRQ